MGQSVAAHVPELLVVGAGLAGAVYARQLADAGMHIQVIDRRRHVAGNAFDEIGSDGVRIHKYGPHLFHTANRSVLTYIQRFAEWVPYTHRVKALLPSGSLTPFPINLDTINDVFKRQLAAESDAKEFLASLALPIPSPQNAAEHLASKIGTELRDLFFRPYTKKMWGLELEEMDASVIKRLPIRYNRDNTYFPSDETQLMPRHGYNKFVMRMLDHPLIDVSLNTSFEHSMLDDYDHCFSSQAIDEFYGYCEGELPYRSVRFHHCSKPMTDKTGAWAITASDQFSVLNFTDDSAFTRETAWHRLPFHIHMHTGRVTLTKEEPCDYRENNYERYYPIKNADGTNEKTYKLYKDLSNVDKNHITFIGRCGTYRYLDMDQVINQSIIGAQHWLTDQKLKHL